MAKKKTNGSKATQFKEGNTKGQGRPKSTPAAKKLARLTRDRFKAAVRKYLGKNRDELTEIAKDANTSALDLMIVSVMNKAIVNGDQNKMQWFLEQLFGKLTENLSVEVTGNAVKPVTVRNLSIEERILQLDKGKKK